MKKTVSLLIVATTACFYTSCYDRSILESKGGVELPVVNNLSYTLSDGSASLTWNIPPDIPSEVSRPLRVNVQVLQYKAGILRAVRIFNETLPDEPQTVSLTIPDDEHEYHAIVKLVGDLQEATYGHSSLIYSLGQTVIIK